MSSVRAVILHPKDDVAVVVQDAHAGTVVEAACSECRFQILARQTIPSGHKIALRRVGRGSPVHKYGEKIGLATTDIEVGDHVHVHNLVSDRVRARS